MQHTSHMRDSIQYANLQYTWCTQTRYKYLVIHKTRILWKFICGCLLNTSKKVVFIVLSLGHLFLMENVRNLVLTFFFFLMGNLRNLVQILRIKSFLNPELVQHLLPDRSRYRLASVWGCLSAVVLNSITVQKGQNPQHQK